MRYVIALVLVLAAGSTMWAQEAATPAPPPDDPRIVSLLQRVGQLEQNTRPTTKEAAQKARKEHPGPVL